MPLPTSGQDWPPRDLSDITRKHHEWNAWYIGDPDGLTDVYRTATAMPFDRVSQRRGGVVGAVARFWWGKPVGNLADQGMQDRLHVPIAADLCQASADLLFAEPPSFTSTSKPAGNELDAAVEAGLVSQLAEGAEIGAALGDVYLRVTEDKDAADRSFITTVHADAAWPTFKWGRLTAVTFWWVVRADDQTVLRHLERHELDNNGIGVTFHGLYEGTPDKLGRLVPLTEHRDTEDISVNAEGYISSETTGLSVVHVPNQRPQRRWRNNPAGRDLGRSDLDGIEPLMDKLDMTYSAWMRDIRLAKARLIVPSFMLESNGPGAGAVFDTEQDVFTRLNTPPREDGKSEITPQQFDIRVEQHRATAQQLVDNILRTAGYSRQTFGEGDDIAQTATEVTSKDRRSNLTRDRKIRAMQPALVQVLRKKLAVDAVVFKSGVPLDVDLAVEFVDTTQADPEALARTNDMLFRSQSASAETRVRLQHPDWDEPTIKTEVTAILAEFGASVPDPGGFRPGVDDASAVPPVGSADAGES